MNTGGAVAQRDAQQGRSEGLARYPDAAGAAEKTADSALAVGCARAAEQGGAARLAGEHWE